MEKSRTKKALKNFRRVLNFASQRVARWSKCIYGIFRERSQKTPMTHFVNRVTLSDLYQSDDPNVNKQVLKNLTPAKKESVNFYKKF
jgi:hypothetical protein